MAVRTVRERIDPRLTASLFAKYRSATDALLELVDNAIDSRLSDRPLEIDLTLRTGSLVLTAVGGLGMSPGQLERDYLRWGASRNSVRAPWRSPRPRSRSRGQKRFPCLPRA